MDFPWLEIPFLPGSGVMKSRSFVRKRRWVRTRAMEGSEAALSAELPHPTLDTPDKIAAAEAAAAEAAATSPPLTVQAALEDASMDSCLLLPGALSPDSAKRRSISAALQNGTSSDLDSSSDHTAAGNGSRRSMQLGEGQQQQQPGTSPAQAPAVVLMDAAERTAAPAAIDEVPSPGGPQASGAAAAAALGSNSSNGGGLTSPLPAAAAQAASSPASERLARLAAAKSLSQDATVRGDDPQTAAVPSASAGNGTPEKLAESANAAPSGPNNAATASVETPSAKTGAVDHSQPVPGSAAIVDVAQPEDPTAGLSTAGSLDLGSIPAVAPCSPGAATATAAAAAAAGSSTPDSAFAAARASRFSPGGPSDASTPTVQAVQVPLVAVDASASVGPRATLGSAGSPPKPSDPPNGVNEVFGAFRTFMNQSTSKLASAIDKDPGINKFKELFKSPDAKPPRPLTNASSTPPMSASAGVESSPDIARSASHSWSGSLGTLASAHSGDFEDSYSQPPAAVVESPSQERDRRNSLPAIPSPGKEGYVHASMASLSSSPHSPKALSPVHQGPRSRPGHKSHAKAD